MTEREIILSELSKISKVVADCDPAVPYQVPSSYFETLPFKMLKLVRAAETAEGDPSLSFNGAAIDNPFSVPAGYFDELAGIILNRIHASTAFSPQEELEAISPLLGKLDKKIPFESPPGYFEELPYDIVSGVSAVDFVNHTYESDISVLGNAKIKTAFQVPDNYFDTLGNIMLQRVKDTGKAKIISFNRKVFRYVAAAIISGVMALGTWLYFQGNLSVAPNIDLTGIDNISDDEIVNYLEDDPVGFLESNTTASLDMKEEVVKELLSDVTDEELQQYLEQFAVSKDPLTN